LGLVSCCEFHASDPTRPAPPLETIDVLYEFALRAEDKAIALSNDLDGKATAGLGVGAVVIGLAAARGHLDPWPAVVFVAGIVAFALAAG
jgi:hypothetical protein